MDSKETKNIWVAVFVIAAVVAGAYYFSTNSSTSPTNSTENNQVDNPLTNSQNIAPKQAAQQTPQTAPIQAPQDNLFNHQQTCAALLTSFEVSMQNNFQKNDAGAQYRAAANWNTSLTDFVVGYSPSLNVCVGGFTNVMTKDPCPSNYGVSCVIRTYSIMNISTNQVIQNYSANLETDASKVEAYNSYKEKLSELTNGQLR